MRIEIPIVVALYYEKHAAATLEIARLLTALLKRSGIDSALHCFSTNPALAHETRLGVNVRACSNENAEFSAYGAGLSSALLSSPAPAGVLFLNDTVGANHRYSPVAYRRLVKAMLESGSAKVCIGRVDRADAAVSVGGTPMNRWVSTHLFFLSSAALACLKFSLPQPSETDQVHVSPDVDRFFDPAMHPSYKAMLQDWLMNPNAPMHWYKAAALGPDNQEALAHKAKSILREHALSVELERCQVAMLDFRPTSMAERVANRALHLLSRKLRV